VAGPKVADGPSVRARVIALVLGIAALSLVHRANAETPRPVLVTIVGHGSIRLRLAAGVTAPCDSSENRMIFDGWLAPGTYTWETGANDVCYQHTSGALREQDWSESRIVSTVMGKRRYRPTVIVVSTD
jgi:hypothetical protein